MKFGCITETGEAGEVDGVKTWKIPVRFMCYGTVAIKARTAEEAVEFYEHHESEFSIADVQDKFESGETLEIDADCGPGSDEILLADIEELS